MRMAYLLSSLALVFLICAHKGETMPTDPNTVGSFHQILQANLELQSLNQSSPPLPDNMFEGDVRLTDDQQRNIDLYGDVNPGRSVDKNTKIRWPGGVIPYEIDCSLHNMPDAMGAIKAAISEWEASTCLRFVRRTNEKDYLWFFRQKGCWCNVGRIGGKTRLSVGYGCEFQHVMTHEIGHAVGFWHEQSRPDRDSYVRVMTQNILPGFESAFAKYGRDRIDSKNVAYDYESIMHYPFNAFSKNGQPTLKTLRPLNGKQPYKKLSRADALQTNIMYNYCKKSAGQRKKRSTETQDVNGEGLGRSRQKRALCFDSNRYCQAYKRQRQCGQNNIRRVCRKTCGVCSLRQSVCSDSDYRCSRYKSYYCRSSAGRQKCRKTCGVCTTGSSSCRDLNGYCASWARRGECRRNPRYMNVNCKKSCGRCPRPRPPTARPRPPTRRPRPPTRRPRPPTPRPRPPTQRPRPPTPRPRPPTARPPPGEVCGVRHYGRSHGRVVDGQTASKNSWPWQAQLRSKYGSHFCGGSLVSKQWVLTAAHCVKGKSASSIHIRLGEHHLSRSDGTEQDFTVTQVVVHPNYRRQNADSDVALLRLNRPARLNNAVSLICLPSEGVSAPTGTSCYISGWGRTGYNSPGAVVLQEAKMPIVNQQTCASAMSRWGSVTRRMICGGFGGNSRVSGCFGDSGGPFVCQGANQKWTLQGAVSWGTRTCSAGKNQYTVYARISEFIPWIRKYIGSTVRPRPPTPPPPTPPRPDTPPPVGTEVTPPRPQTPPPVTEVTPPRPQTPPPVTDKTPPPPNTPPPVTAAPPRTPPPPTAKPVPCLSPKALGFESKEIQDSSLSASSSHNRWHGPKEARLNRQPSPAGVGAWCAASPLTKNEYLEVDLGTRHVITHVATQGRVGGWPKFVKTYFIHYSDNGNTWTRHPTEFQGNIDTSTVTKNTIVPAVTARYIRINPTSWKSTLCLRAELYGCKVKRPLPPTHLPPPLPTTTGPPLPTDRPRPPTPPQPTTVRPQPPVVTTKPPIKPPVVVSTIPPNPIGIKCADYHPTCPEWARTRRCNEYYVKQNCKKSCNSKFCDREQVRPNAPCASPMGIGWENRLPDSAFTASSELNLGTWDAGPRNARMYTTDTFSSKRIGAWCPGERDNQWLQVDLGMNKYITYVATQGRDKYFERVKTFTLAYSLDGVNWDNVKENFATKIFQGGCDHFTPQINRLPRGVTARFIRFMPKESTYPCMRVEVFGCSA